MNQNIDEQLRKLKELLGEYNEAAYELLHHHNEEHQHHLVNHLREKLIHLEELRHQEYEDNINKKEHFLKHHFEGIQHASNHWHHVRHHLSHIFEAAELTELHNRMQHLMEEIEKEKYELEHNNHYNHYRGPTPNPYARTVERKD